MKKFNFFKPHLAFPLVTYYENHFWMKHHLTFNIDQLPF
jgi:hypothetical protein